jgi:hypothetical protein
MRDIPCPKPDFEDHDVREFAQGIANVFGTAITALKRPDGRALLMRTKMAPEDIASRMAACGYRDMGTFRVKWVDPQPLPPDASEAEEDDDGSAT